MERLGRRLREARQAQGSTLEDAEAATHIRTHFLEALEAGDFASFAGGGVQVRGFLRIYARYLELSAEDIVAHYNAEMRGEDYSAVEPEENDSEPHPDGPPEDLTSIRFRPRDIPVSSSLPRWMSVRTVIIVGIVLTALLAALALASYLMNRPEEGPSWLSSAQIAARNLMPAWTGISSLEPPILTFPLFRDDEVAVDQRATVNRTLLSRRASWATRSFHLGERPGRSTLGGSPA